jgi:hypothetical protein
LPNAKRTHCFPRSMREEHDRHQRDNQAFLYQLDFSVSIAASISSERS